MRSPTWILACSAVPILAASAPSQTLLADVNPDRIDESSNPMTLARAGPLAYVRASSRVARLWRTDGTAAGTLPLPLGAPDTGDVHEAADLDGSGRVLLSVTTTVNGRSQGELWISDGTAATTRRLLAQDARGLLPLAPNQVLFFSSAGGTGQELWVSNGTAGGTRLVADLSPGPASSTPLAAAVLGGQALILANTSAGIELIASDATAAGTVSLRAFPRTQIPDRMVVAGGAAFFVADDGVNDFELWRSDGTAGGTFLITDFNPAQNVRIAELTAVGARLMFTTGAANPGLYATDGTIGGTVLVLPIVAQHLVAIAGRLYFAHSEPATGTELWSSDGTAAGTRLEADLVPGPVGSQPMRIAAAGSGLVVQTAAGDYYGIRAGAVTPLGMRTDNPAPGPLLDVGGRLLISVADPSIGEELFATDATVSGTVPIGNLAPPRPVASVIGNLAELDDVIYFAAYAGAAVGRSLWRSDGTAAGTRMVRPFTGAQVLAAIERVGDRLFIAQDSLWVSDGTAAGTRPVPGTPFTGAQIVASPVAGEALLVAFDAATGNELWHSDGTAAGTRLLRDIEPGPGSGQPTGLRRLGGLVLFGASDQASGHELWASDGTAAGTARIRDLHPGPASGLGNFLGEVGGRLLFAGYPGPTLWTTDGTPAGTGMLVPTMPTAIDFAARAAVLAWGSEIYLTDGATLSHAGHAPADIGALAIAGDVVFMTLQSGGGQAELAVLEPNGVLTPLGSFPRIFSLTAAGTGRHVLFAASRRTPYPDLWTSDGSSAGTRMVYAFGTGNAGTPGGFQRHLDRILFFADDGTTGREPWSLRLADLGAPLAVSRGLGCPGGGGIVPRLRAAGQPTFGNPGFGLEMTAARPSAPGALWLGAGIRQPLGSCTVLADPALVLPWTTTPAGFAGVGLSLARGLLGQAVSAQAAVLDPAGGLHGTASMTAGLLIVVGR